MTETLHTSADGIVYRWARELHGTNAPPADGPAVVLRVLDLDDQIRAAGLYPGFEPDINNYQTAGTMLTTEIDALVVKMKLPDDETAQDEALLGIAYQRLRQQMGIGNDNGNERRIWIPAKLKEWRVEGPYFQHNMAMTVQAASRETAKVIAGVRLLDGADQELRAIAAV